MKRFVVKRLSAMRESKPTGTIFDGIDVAASFRAVVDDIVVANRQPTAWEAGCLYAALCELATGRERNARRRICLALLPGALQELPGQNLSSAHSRGIAAGLGPDLAN